MPRELPEVGGDRPGDVLDDLGLLQVDGVVHGHLRDDLELPGVGGEGPGGEGPGDLLDDLQLQEDRLELPEVKGADPAVLLDLLELPEFEGLDHLGMDGDGLNVAEPLDDGVWHLGDLLDWLGLASNVQLDAAESGGAEPFFTR